MHHHNREGRCHFNHEITVGNRIHAVQGDSWKAQQFSRISPVYRIVRAGQGAGSERHDIESAFGITYSTFVPFEHLHIRQQVMGKQDRLGPLQVGIPRHHECAVCIGFCDEHALESG